MGRLQFSDCSFHENFRGQQENIELIRSVTDAWAAESGGVEYRGFDQLSPELNHETQHLWHVLNSTYTLLSVY